MLRTKPSVGLASHLPTLKGGVRGKKVMLKMVPSVLEPRVAAVVVACRILTRNVLERLYACQTFKQWLSGAPEIWSRTTAMLSFSCHSGTTNHEAVFGPGLVLVTVT